LGPFIYAYFVGLENISYFLLASMISSLAGVLIMHFELKNKILPQVRFWTKDS